MDFGNPQNFWYLSIIPILATFFVWVVVRKRRSLVQFAGTELSEKLIQGSSRRRQYLKFVLFASGTLFLILALAGPRLGAKLSMATRSGVDVVFVLDVSRSMQARDVKPSRLQRAKYQIGQLVDQLAGNRVGLVGFAGVAQVVCPLTLDHGAVRLFLDALTPSSIPVRGTALADALRAAVKCFDAEENYSKSVIVFTDGEDHLGETLEAAEALAAFGVRIYVLGMGTQEGELIPLQVEAGSFNYHKDGQGNYVKTRLNESFLKQVALTTDGSYFHTSLRGEELEWIYDSLQELEKREFGSHRFTEFEERYQIPLFLALVCFAAELLLSEYRLKRTEWRGRFE